MKKIIIFLIICFPILGCQNKQNKTGKQSEEIPIKTNEIKPGDFRNAKWGMSKEQVKKTELSKPIGENDGLLGYEDKIANLTCQIAFEFVDDTLSSAHYLIKEKHINDNDYITDFNKLKDLLSEKYGKPSMDKIVWKGSLYKGDVEHYGLAVISGELVYAAQWQTELTNITLILSGDNFTPYLAIMYESSQYKYLKDKKEKKKMLNGL